MNGMPISLAAALRRAHLRLVFVALLTAGLALTLISFLTLRLHVEENLRLVARSIAYAAQAATSFRDSVAAAEILNLIAPAEDLSAAEILDRDGHRLASYQRQSDGKVDAALRSFAEQVFPQHASVDVLLDESVVGRVVLRGNGVVYLEFFLKAIAAMFAGLACVMVALARLARHLDRELVQPLKTLASLTRSISTDNAFERRAPAASIKEINELGKDFNVLLGEIQAREASLVARHESLQSANASLSFLAYHDTLTGLPNRAYFLQRLAQEIGAARPGPARLAVLFLDGDDFKAINDKHGHAAGDAWLTAAGRRLSGLIRESDMVARIGGDEFAVLLTPIRSIEDARSVAAKLAARMSEPLSSEAFGVIVGGASVGVAVYPEHASDMHGLMTAADAAMYAAKANATGSFVVYEPDMLEADSRDNQMRKRG